MQGPQYDGRPSFKDGKPTLTLTAISTKTPPPLISECQSDGLSYHADIMALLAQQSSSALPQKSTQFGNESKVTMHRGSHF